MFVSSAYEVDSQGGGEVNTLIELIALLVTGECNDVDEEGDEQSNFHFVKIVQLDFGIQCLHNVLPCWWCCSIHILSLFILSGKDTKIIDSFILLLFAFYVKYPTFVSKFDIQMKKELDKVLMEQYHLHYMTNAAILQQALTEARIKFWGGVNSPYIWVESPYGTSWKLFDKLLNGCYILSSPGERFGPRGKGFVRLSSFANQTKVIIAGTRIADLRI